MGGGGRAGGVRLYLGLLKKKIGVDLVVDVFFGFRGAWCFSTSLAFSLGLAWRGRGGAFVRGRIYQDDPGLPCRRGGGGL